MIHTIFRRFRTAMILVLLVGCTEGGLVRGDPVSPAPDPTLDVQEERLARGPFADMACNLPVSHLRRIWQGYVPERSGEIQIVPQAPHFIGRWLSHSGPWGYVQRIPMFLYGPGHVPAGRSVDRPVTVADVAPTMAQYLRFDFQAPDGRPLLEAFRPDLAKPPRLIVVMVWDAVGRNVLDEYPDAWPSLRSMLPEGTWYENAVVGSSPSVTPSVHASLGTGAFPRSHGLVDLRFRVGDELLASRSVGPEQLLAPTLGDAYDMAMDNEPRIGLVASGGTLMMMGRGSRAPGVSPHIAVAEFKGKFGAGVNAQYYRYPSYVDEVPGPEVMAREVDASDGEFDGQWMGEPVLEDREGLSLTPAFSDYQTRVIKELVRREGFGSDDVPDLLFTNYKQTDHASHRWSMNSPQMEALLRSTDDALGELVAFLDRWVGEGKWVLALTSDHGSTPDPATTGAFVIDNQKLAQDIRDEFDPPGAERSVLQDLRVTHLWMDLEAMGDAEVTVEDVAAFLAAYTKGQNAEDPSALSEDERGDRLFEAAFPSEIMEHLPCLPGRRE